MYLNDRNCFGTWSIGMTTFENFNKPFGIKNYINTCIEFFPPPLPNKSSSSDEEFVESYDLFQSSMDFNFEPIFIPPSEEITICELDVDNFELIPGSDKIISGKDFLKFQLQKINIDTLIQLPSRVDFSLYDELKTDLLKQTLDPSIELNDWGEPVDESKYPYWLNYSDNLFNIHKPIEKDYVKEWEENLKIGKKFLEEFRISHSSLLLDPLADAILDPDWGIYNHWETKIENLSEVRQSYSKWNCPLMIIYSGKMWPQYTNNGWPNFNSPTYNIYDVYLRNNDEGTPI